MPLSEEEQRILHEMEQKLYEHDRAFVDRVSTTVHRHRNRTHASGRWSIAGFVAGFVVLLVSFRSSIVLGSLGFLIMLVAALAYVHRPTEAGATRAAWGRRSSRGHGVSEEWSEMRRRMRSRFGNRS